ncbi:MAG: iron transporter [Candidatus Rokubacteria bacterium]|nr:iron transporter [Candidatus Rokubacteria bacterium]
MTIKATLTKLDGGQVIALDVLPMIGSAFQSFQYGENGALPGKGRYRIDLEIQPPQLMRYATAKERWTAASKLSFDFDHR